MKEYEKYKLQRGGEVLFHFRKARGYVRVRSISAAKEACARLTRTVDSETDDTVGLISSDFPFSGNSGLSSSSPRTMATSLTSGVEGYTAQQKGVNKRRI
jgi:hypothetical protein